MREMKKAFLQLLFPQAFNNVPRLRLGFEGEWEEQKLGDVARMFDGLRVPVSGVLRKSGSTPYYGANGIQGYIDGYTHDGEFVLVAEDGANDISCYPVRYVRNKIWVNNHAHVLQGIPKITNTLFLSYLMETINYKPYLVGGTRAKLNGGILKEIPVSMPTFTEQQRLGLFFRSLDEQISAQIEKLKQTKLLKSVFLIKMFI